MLKKLVLFDIDGTLLSMNTVNRTILADALKKVYGTEGTITAPDPNQFSEKTAIYTEKEPEWKDVEPLAGYFDAGRGFGLSEMARAIEENRPHRVSGDLGLHILEVMQAILHSGRTDERMRITSSVDSIALVPLSHEV